jgi:hypothetical protein
MRKEPCHESLCASGAIVPIALFCEQPVSPLKGLLAPVDSHLGTLSALPAFVVTGWLAVYSDS